MIEELRTFLGGAPLEWAPRLTAVFLLSVRPWRQHEPSGSFANLLGKLYLFLLVAAVLLQKVAAAPGFWFFLTAVHFLWIITAYTMADNHRYLEGYWCLALAISLWFGGPTGSHYLELDARLLIGLCFLFAVLWKTWNRSYRDGSFFVDRLLFEQRFLPLAFWIGGLSPKLQIQHLEAKRLLATGRSNLAQAPVPNRLRRTGVFLTWWTIAIEVLIAIIFLLPLPHLDLGRAVVLGIFVVTTYLLVPVPSFGQILLLMLLVAIDDVQIRMMVLGLAISLTVFAGLAHFMERVARRRMNAQLQETRTPRYRWTPSATPRRLEKDGASWRLIFPSVGLSLYVEGSWLAALERLLETTHPFLWEDLFPTNTKKRDTGWEEFLSLLKKLKLIGPAGPTSP